MLPTIGYLRYFLNTVDFKAGKPKMCGGPKPQSPGNPPPIIGSRMRMTWMAAGPMITMMIAGKIQTTRGNSIFVGTLAADSSARICRLRRRSSEKTRRDQSRL